MTLFGTNAPSGPTRTRPMRRVLVDARTSLNYEMVAPVVEAMERDPRIRFAFTASEEPARVGEIYAAASPAHARITPWRAALTSWDVYLTSDFMWATLPRGAARVQMYHGVAGKYGFDAPAVSLRAWDRIFFINERRLRNVVASDALDRGDPAARLVGMPKVDCLVDGSLRRDQVLACARLDPARPTVLYAPTWSAYSSLNRMGVPLLERLVRMPLNVIVKLHDRSLDLRAAYSGGEDWRARLSPILSPPHALLAGSGSIAPWLAAADVMISDHSSAAYEYLLLDRPIVRIELPELLARANVHADYVQMLADASHTVRSHADAADAVETALSDPGSRSAARRRVASDLFYRPGTATARAVAALYELMALPAPGPSVRREAAAGDGAARGSGSSSGATTCAADRATAEAGR